CVAARFTPRCIAATRAAQASRRRARSLRDPGLGVRRRRRPPRAAARKSRSRPAEALRNGDRDALARRSLVAALDRSGAAPVLGLADHLRRLAALARQIGRALQL